MLWYKSWLETRWRFLIGLAVLVLLRGRRRVRVPQVAELLPLVPARDAGGRDRAGGSASPRSWRATTAATSGRSGSGRT